MNPLKSITGTLVLGFVTSIILMVLLGSGDFNKWSMIVWLHVFAGVIWIGLLYYFNFVQAPAVAAGAADSDGPGPAAINKYVAPLALLWFRWAALATWLTGAAALEIMPGTSMVNAFAMESGSQIIGAGAWMGTIMLINVWMIIWPNQKRILGIVEATADEIVSAKFKALMASRTNTFLSIPMLMCMVGQGHGLPF